MSYTLSLRPGKNSQGEQGIRIRSQVGGKNIEKLIGLRIKPEHWDKSKQIAKRNHPNSIAFNRELKQATIEFDKLIEDTRDATGKIKVTGSDIKKVLKAKANIKPKLDFFEFWDVNIEQLKGTVKPKRIRDYADTLLVIKRFVKHSGYKVSFDTIDNDFYYEFTSYMRQVLNYSTNTIGAHFKNIKAAMRSAIEAKHTSNMDFKSKRFVAVQESVESTYLDMEELRAIQELDLSHDPRLDKARDLLIVGCFTGLRFINFTNIKPEFIQGDDIVYLGVAKNGGNATIPILLPLRKVMNKWKGITSNSLPPAMSNTWFNVYVKEVCRMAGIDDVFTIKGVLYKKYQLISSHVGRKSYCTNMYNLGVPAHDIMQISKHKTESIFFHYIKTTKKQSADTIREVYSNAETRLMVV